MALGASKQLQARETFNNDDQPESWHAIDEKRVKLRDGSDDGDFDYVTLVVYLASSRLRIKSIRDPF